jgi:hypothetical protein
VDVKKWLHKWAHRRGIARTINTSTGGFMGERCTAYLETRGPAWLGQRLWRFALLTDRTSAIPDLDTLRVTKRERLGRYTYRWHVAYSRLSR